MKLCSFTVSNNRIRVDSTKKMRLTHAFCFLTTKIIQSFFVSAVSGTVTAELTNIIENPDEIMNILANSLPAQSSYFIQICFVFTFLLQGFDLLRVQELTLAFFRHYVFGPRLTAKERSNTWRCFRSLEDPRPFWHPEVFSQIMLFFVVFFVYSVIAPITSVFLGGCFLICESGYRCTLIICIL